MGDEIAQLLREFEEAMTDFFAGEQRDATPLGQKIEAVEGIVRVRR
jgi:hypothetical protein